MKWGIQMGLNTKRWHLTEFSKELSNRFSQRTGNKESVHYNTVTNWFNGLEDLGLHYVNKVEDTRQFDEKDMNIALKIMEMRKNKLQLNVIYKVLPKEDMRLQDPKVMKSDSPGYDAEELKEILVEQMDKFSIQANHKNQKILQYFEISNQIQSLVSQRQNLIISQNSLESKVDHIDSKLENIELRKDFIELKAVKVVADSAAKTKDKGFFAKLFGGQGQINEDKVLSPEDKEKINQLENQYSELEEERKSTLEEIEKKTSEIEEISRDIENNYSKPLAEVQESLLIEYQENMNKEGETIS